MLNKKHRRLKSRLFTHIIGAREEYFRIALRNYATAKRMLSELPDLPCARVDLRHLTLSYRQRLRWLCADITFASVHLYLHLSV